MAKLHARIGTLRQLEILLAVKTTGSVTAAANQLHLTQPSVSMQLKKLSDAVGSQLYYQQGKQLLFTEAGELVAETARSILHEIDVLDMNLAGLQGLTRGKLKIAVVTTAKYFTPHLLGDFLELYPGIELELKVGNRAQILARLKRGDDDLYIFSHPPEDIAIDLLEFFPNPLVAIASDKHPLAGKPSVPLEEFCQQPFLMRELGSGTRYAIENHFAKLDHKLNVMMTIESNEAIKHMVMANMGVTILSRHTLQFDGHAGLAELAIESFPINTSWFLVRQQQRPASPVTQALLDYVQKPKQLDGLKGQYDLEN